MATEKKDLAWLVELVETKAKLEVTPANVRSAIRSLVKAGEIDDPKDEGRYEFKGVNDPTVKAIVAKLKENATRGEEKAAAAPKRATKAKTEKAAPAKRSRRKAKPVEEDEDEEVFDDEELDLDD